MSKFHHPQLDDTENDTTPKCRCCNEKIPEHSTETLMCPHCEHDLEDTHSMN